MRLPESDIKAALLNPEQIVRDAAIQYFALSLSRDRSVMPVAVQAIEKYGWEEAFYGVWLLENLPQTDETLPWLVGQLDQPSVHGTDAEDWICRMIAATDTELLARHQGLVLACDGVDDECREEVEGKISLLGAAPNDCWRELEAQCEQHKDDKDNDSFDFGGAYRLVEAISRDGAKQAERVADLLSRPVSGVGDPLAWMEIVVAKLAGLLRVESLAPLLVAKLKLDHGDFVDDECRDALVRIGSDAAVDAITKDFSSTPWEYRLYGSAALEDMRADSVVPVSLDLLKDEKDGDVEVNLVGAALANFDPEGVRLARDLRLRRIHELQRRLIGTAILMGERFPELHRWLDEERKQHAEMQRRTKELTHGDLLETLRKLAGKEGELPEDEVVEGSPLDEPLEPSAPEVPYEPTAPIVRGEKIGRNDPCPCGSGKKYKKCCLGKD